MLTGIKEYAISQRYRIILEDNYPMTADILDRHIHSLILQANFQYVKGIVLGRFQVGSKITVDLLQKIVDQKNGQAYL